MYQTQINTTYLLKQATLSLCDAISYPLRASYSLATKLAKSTLYLLAKSRIKADQERYQREAQRLQALSKQEQSRSKEYRENVLKSLRMQEQVKELSQRYPQLDKHEIYYQLKLGKDPLKVFAGRIGGKTTNK